MRVRFKRAVREGLCHAEPGMEWDTGEDEGRFLLARGWADQVKDQPPRPSGAGPRRCETSTTSPRPSATTWPARPRRREVRPSGSQGD
jgi:hypothetical protein